MKKRMLKMVSLIMVITVMISISSMCGYALEPTPAIGTIPSNGEEISPNSTVVGIAYFYDESSAYYTFGAGHKASDVGAPGGTIWATRSLTVRTEFSVTLSWDAKLAIAKALNIDVNLKLENNLGQGSGYSYAVGENEYARIMWKPKLRVSNGTLTTVISYATGTETITQNITVYVPVEMSPGIADGQYYAVTSPNENNI